MIKSSKMLQVCNSNNEPGNKNLKNRFQSGKTIYAPKKRTYAFGRSESLVATPRVR